MNLPFKPNTYDQVASALSVIDAHDRDLWLRMGMAVKSELGEDGFRVWDSWSANATNYQPKAALATWKSIDPIGSVTVASLFNEALVNGWRPTTPYTPPIPEQRALIEAERKAAAIEAEQQQAQERAKAKEDVSALWPKLNDVDPNHPYIIAKGIMPYGAKQLKNKIVLPLRANGELVSLQFIDGTGKKIFQLGGQVKDTSMVIGAIKGAPEAILCEGWATGCTLHQATGKPVVVAWNANNLPVIAKRLNDTFPTMALRICGDNDVSGTGQKAAIAAVQVHSLAVWCAPDFSAIAQSEGLTDSPTDFNDLHQLMGLDEVRRQVALAVPTENTDDLQGYPKSVGMVGMVGMVGRNLEELSIYAVCSPINSFPLPENSVGRKSSQWEGNQKLAFFMVDGVTGVRSGVYWHEPKNEDDDKELTHPLWLCSPLHIRAETRDAEQSNWGRLLQWSDNDGHSHTWACPMAMLASSDTSKFREALIEDGLTINGSTRARQRLTDYVTTYPPEMDERMRCVTRIGWHGLRYVLPHSVYGDQTGEGVIYQGADIGDFAQAGTLAEWQQHVSKPAVGNSRIVFALSVAFTGVLCEMAGESGGGFHFVGTTSKGKTSTLLDPAASVWGNPERYAKKWRTTTNGLESLCVGRNDGLLILDELAQVAPQEAGSAAYLIANGQAKARMTKEGGSRPSSTWRVMLLSAGEIDLSQHMAEGGKTAKGGQMARLPAIPADAGKGLGTLENLHQFANGQAFADSLKNNTRQHCGTAGTAFLNRLTSAEELANVRSTIRARLATISALLDVPKGCAPEVGRVASRFALTALAGELASSYGITGWQEGEATTAVKRCFTDWLTENGAGIGNDDVALVSQVTAFMQTHSCTRFPPNNSESEELARCQNRAGFSNSTLNSGTEYWVQTEAFKNELCRGFNTKLAAITLTRFGFLQDGDIEQKDGKAMKRLTQKKWVRSMAKSLPFYVFNDSVLEGAI